MSHCGIISSITEPTKTKLKKTANPNSHCLVDDILQSPRLPRENPLIQTNPHGILRIKLRIKRRLKVSMRTQTLLDKPTAPTSRPQLQRLEPVDVLGVEEHVPDRNDLLVDLERVAREDGALGDDTGLVGCDDCACCDEVEVVNVEAVGVGGIEDLGVVVLGGFGLEDEDGDGAEG